MKKKVIKIKEELLTSFYHKNHGALGLAVLASVLGGTIGMWVSWIMQELIDSASGVEGAKPLSELAWQSLICLIFIAFCLYLNYVSEPRFIRRAMQQYKELVFTKLTEKSASSFREESTATYLSALTNDATRIETDYLGNLLAMLGQIVSFISALTLMLIYSPLMTAIAAGLTVLPLIGSLLTGQRLETAEKKVSERNKTFTGMLSECLNGFPVVKSFQAEKEIQGLFQEKNQELEQQKFLRRRIAALISLIGNMAGIIAQLGVFLIGAWLSLQGKGLTPGIVIAFVNLMNGLLNPISVLPGMIAGRKAAKGLVEKLADALTMNSEQDGSKEIAEVSEGIRLTDVTFGYEEGKDVLHDVDAFFEAGKAYAIVGGSGSGKSTLLNLLMAGGKGYRGKICYDETELRDVSVDSLYRNVAMIQQSVFVFDASIRDNVSMFRDFPKEEVQEALRRASLEALVAQRGEEYRCGENGNGLSGGEKQRISIARSLLRKSSVLLVDEATAALDKETAYHVSDDILNLAGITRIVVTHALEERLLRRYDGILVMKDGRIAESGSFDELMNQNGYFRALYTVSQ
jgi:ABC-type multidrug transport system fused ATPase/permease subunit